MASSPGQVLSARHAAVRATGAKAIPMAEAVAAGLGFPSHADLLEAAGRRGPWDGAACMARLLELDPDMGEEAAARAAEAAGQAFPETHLGPLAAIMAGLCEAGGGLVTVRGEGTSSRVTVPKPPGPNHGSGLPPGIRYDQATRSLLGELAGTHDVPTEDARLEGVSFWELLAGIERQSPAGTRPGPRHDGEPGAGRYGTMPAGRAGLPDGNVPVSYVVRTDGTGAPEILLEVPPRRTPVAGAVELIGFVTETAALGAIREAANPDPGLRVVMGRPGSHAPGIASHAASATPCARGVVMDFTMLPPPRAPDGLPEGLPLNAPRPAVVVLPPLPGHAHGLPVRMARDAAPLRGSVVLLPVLQGSRDVDMARELVGAGAAVWTSAYAEGDFEGRLAELGIGPGDEALSLAVSVDPGSGFVSRPASQEPGEPDPTGWTIRM